MLPSRWNKRKRQRKPKHHPAWISYGAQKPLVPCLLCDISENGARLSPSQFNILPDVFTLVLSKDGSSRRLCQIVWRKNLYIGVEFITSAGLPPGVEKLAHAKSVEATAEAVRAQLTLRRRYLSQRSDSRAAAYIGRREFGGSSVAIGMLVLLLSMTAVFYVAGLQIDTPWARELCENATNLCEHPELSGVGAVLMTGVYLAMKGMEV